LDAVIREEIGGSQERELQMEVCWSDVCLCVRFKVLT
jgi:hypothetical protein